MIDRMRTIVRGESKEVCHEKENIGVIVGTCTYRRAD